MLAVSNTSPISNLAYIGRLSLLRSRFSEVWIPAAVSLELRAHPDSAAAAEIESALRDNWIRVRTTSRSHLVRVLGQRLDLGEAEAIALAIEMKADIVLLDEIEARNVAARLDLTVVGILGILLGAKLQGEIPAVRPEIRLLRERGNFFVSPKLEAEILAAAGE